MQDPFSPVGNMLDLDRVEPAQRTEEHEAAAREREAEELREAQKAAAIKHKLARRKTMENRRVSFAAEATLHTWREIETVEDSTTSSASDSTRRQSSGATSTPNTSEPNSVPGSDQSEPPSTPPEQVQEPLVNASPVHQRDLHQKHRRRSSGASNALSDVVVQNDSSPVSTYSGSSAAGDSSPINVEDSIHSSSDEDGDTAMSIDDATAETVRSELSSSSTGSSLDERLRRAAAEAGTRGIEYDENGDDLSMELANGTITNAFQPWVNGQPSVPAQGTGDHEDEEDDEELSMELADGTLTTAFQPWENRRSLPAAQHNSAMQDQENINPFSPAFKRQTNGALTSTADKAEEDGTQDMTMDMTMAAGEILCKTPSPNKRARESFKAGTAASPTKKVHFSNPGETSEEIATQSTDMDMTTAIGGILSKKPSPNKRRHSPSMEVKASPNKKMHLLEPSEEPEEKETQSIAMDMTISAGHILSKRPSPNKRRQSFAAEAKASPKKKMHLLEPNEEAGQQETRSIAMDMTVPADYIFSKKLSPNKRRQSSITATKASPLKKAHSPKPEYLPKENDTQSMPMDMTAAIGSISSKKPSSSKCRQESSTTPAKSSPIKKAHLPTPGHVSEDHGSRNVLSKESSPGKGRRISYAVQKEASPMGKGNLQISPKKICKPEEAVASDSNTVVPALPDQKSDEASEAEAPKISLQDFLNMTNIQFMELSTTKRRHTMAPGGPLKYSQESSSTSSCFAAAATTLPLLELYQHATRELKSYISSGRKIIRTIEQETLEEQPALFREYINARPDVKMVMDNQFRNGKANARLQSKEGWYAWRRQLVQGLHAGLNDIKADMEEDAQALTQQEARLNETVPQLVKHLGELEEEARSLQQRAENFESIDQESLINARAQLESADDEVSQKTLLLTQLQEQMAAKAEALAAAEELKTEFQDQIGEAERVQDECRGWKAEEVRHSKMRVKMIEKKTGWTLVTAEHEVEKGDIDFGPALIMRYCNALRLFFYPATFQQNPSEQKGRRSSRRSKSDSGPSAPISLTYAPAQVDSGTSAELTTEQRFFVQLLQGHLHALAVLPKGSTRIRTLLNIVSEGWDLAVKVSEEIRQLGIAGITKVSILSDEKLGARCMLLLAEKVRVDVQFTLTVTISSEGNINSKVMVEAVPKYGSISALFAGAQASKVREALNKQVSLRTIGDGAWVAAVKGLEDWVNLQKSEPKKQHQNVKKPASKPTPAPVPVSIPAQDDTPMPAPAVPRKEFKKPVPVQEVIEDAAARQEELRRPEEEMLIAATKTPAGPGRRPGALRRSP